MSSIEQRVVQMKFDNAQFEAGVKQTLASLAALNKGLKLEGATKGLHDLTTAGKNVAPSLANVEHGVNSIADKFKTMSVVAITALATIAHQAVATGGQLVKSLTIGPIIQGLHEYETQLNSIQTILANTAHQGTNLRQVNDALEVLNRYSDQTIYNFGEMAKNIGTFTAAGVKLEVATEAIKGIANLAAISGSNSQQAATAMYQLSQALAAGKVSLMDWNSVVNAGMGGKVFQDALMETARIHGVAIDTMVKDAGSFRNTLEKGWLTGEILTETLSKFTGDLTAAQLKTMGYNDQQIAQILKMGKTAQDAATKVKTMSQLISTLQEASGSGWAKTWQLIFGDFEEARTLWTNVNNVIGGFITRSAEARNKVIGDWKELGGRKVLIDGIALAFNNLMEIITPIGKAFRDIFPRTTGQDLYNLTVAFRDFMSAARLGEDTMDNIRRTAAGFFAILGIGWDIIKEGTKLFFRLFGIVTEGSGGILEFTGNIGDFFVGLRKALQEGRGLEKFFEGLGKIIEPPIRLIKNLISLFGELFGSFDGDKAADSVGNFVENLSPLERLGNVISTVWGKVFSVLDNVFEFFFPMASKLGSAIRELTANISEAVGGLNFDDILGAINTGLFAGLILTLRNMFGGGGGGLLNQVSNTLEQVTDTLGAMQNTLRAATLLQIAIALGILALAIDKLAKIDAAGLTRALTAMAVMFTQLFASMALFQKLVSVTDIAEIFAISAAMILLATAVNILASAVEKLSGLDWNGLAKGLVGVTVLLGAMAATAKFMPNPAGLISTGLGMIVLATAIKILASAVQDLSGISWEEMAKGLTGVGALLAGLTLFTRFAQANKGGLVTGVGIVLLAAGIKILASAVSDFATLSWEDIAKGLVGVAGGLLLMGTAISLIPPSSVLSAAGIFITAASLGMVADALDQMAGMSWAEIGRGLTVLAGALTAIGLAISLIPPTSLLSAAAVFVVAASLGMMTDALKSMASMSWEEIAKGLVMLAGSLGIIAIAMNAMTTALPGAAALLVVAASLAVLAPILLLFGNMSWGEMAKGLLMLAGVFTVLGVAGLVLTPLVPTLLGLGVAITLLGVGIAAAGAGVFLFATALTALSVAGAAGTVAMVGFVSAMAGLIPEVMRQIGLGVVAFAETIAMAGPAITKAITTVLLALITAIEKTSPKIQQTLAKMLMQMLDLLVKNVPKMTAAGLKILIGFLNGISRNIGKVVQAATTVAVNFINGIADNQGRVIAAGVNLIIKFVNGLADAIRSNSARMNAAGRNLASAIIEGMASGIMGGIGAVTSAARRVAQRALDAAKNFLGISSPSKEFTEVGKWSAEGLAYGLDKYAKVVVKPAEEIGKMAISSLSKSLTQMGGTFGNDLDLAPRITPVLDLTNVKRDAGKIKGYLPRRPFVASMSFSAAQDASAGQSSNSQFSDDDDPDTSPRPAMIQYNQYNTSPKALSTADVYRQTKNQLSTVKGAVSK